MVGVNPARAQACIVWARQRSLMIQGSVASRIMNRWSSSSGTVSSLGGAGRVGWSKVMARSHSARCSSGYAWSGPASTSETVMSRPRGGQVGERGGDEGGVAAGQRGQPDVAGGGAGERGELGFGGGQLGGDRVGEAQ